MPSSSHPRAGAQLASSIFFGLLLGVTLLAAGCTDDTAPPTALESVPEEVDPPAVKLTADQRIRQEMQHVDPSLDGWSTEELEGAASSRLHELQESLNGSDPLKASDFADWVTEEFWCSPLVPEHTEGTQQASGLRIRVDKPAEQRREGAKGLAHSVTELRQAFADAGAVRLHTKIIAVEPESNNAYESTVLVQVWADSPDSSPIQENGTWVAGWSWPDREQPPRLTHLELIESSAAQAEQQFFSDCTEAVIGHTKAWTEQLLRGTDDWCARIDVAAQMNQYAHNGITVGDFDGDGLEDLYVLQSGGLPNLLFRQLPDGTAEEVAGELGLDWLDEHRAALLVDLDNDGTRELVITARRSVLIARRGTSGRYFVVSELATPDGYSIAAADYDEDGLLDLYVCGYQPPLDILPTPYHDALNGAKNALYKNRGKLRFENYTRSTGLDVDNGRFSFAATWIDYDDDGDQDLYVANDFGRNNLFMNEEGRFVDVAGEAGVEDMAAGMGISWSDYDADGDMDLYVSNMFSSAGNRIAYQRQFQVDSTEDTRSAFQRHARGNSLFANQGDGSFLDATESSGTWMGRWAWGAQFVDFDNDGREDIFVPNGFMTNERTNDL